MSDFDKKVPSRSRIPGVPGPVNILEIGGDGMPTQIIIRNGQIYVFDESGQTLIDNGIIQTVGIAAQSIVAEKIAIGQSAFTHNITHWSLNYYQVYFNSGTIYWANGQTVTTDAGWLDVFGTTYLYYNDSTTLSATTNIAETVGDDKMLVAILTPGTTWGQEVSVEWKQAAGTTIDGDSISTNTINANRLNVVSINATGYINASYITAGTMAVGGSGAASPGKMSFLDGFDAEYGKINSVGLIFVNSKGIFLHNVDQAGEPAFFYNDPSNQLWIRGGDANIFGLLDKAATTIFTFDLNNGVLRSQKIGNYYMVGGVGTEGSMIMKAETTFWGTGFGNINIPWTFGVTFSGVSAISGIALGRVTPMNNFESGVDTGYPFASSGASASNEKLAQQFTTPSAQDVSCVSALFAKTGTPAGTMVAEIFADSGGLPTGSALGTSDALTIDSAVPGDYPGSFDFAGFNFSTPISLTGSTVYHLVIRTIGFTRSVGVTELYWGGDAGGTHTGDGEEYNGTVWAAISPATVLYFRIYADDVYTSTEYLVSSDFFTVLAQDITTTSVGLVMAQLEITINTFALGTRYAAIVGVFGDLP